MPSDLRTDPQSVAILRRGDALELVAELENRSIDCVVTSPPYWHARAYNDDRRELGNLDQSLAEYVDSLVGLFEALTPKLVRGAPVWLNIGGRYASGGFGLPGPKLGDRESWDDMVGAGRQQPPPPGYHPRDLLDLPAKVAEAIRSRTPLILRVAIVWNKMVASEPPVRDRPSRSYEMVYVFTNGHPSRMADPGATWFKTSVWSIKVASSKQNNHPASMPLELAKRCIEASGSPRTVLDPFCGSGTTLAAAARLGVPRSIGFDLSADYLATARKRLIRDKVPLLQTTVVTDSDRRCEVCGGPLEGRSDRLTCSGRCKKAKSRRERADTPVEAVA